jgi:anaerobic ribonucleoside-triphosphate reductase activating protein
MTIPATGDAAGGPPSTVRVYRTMDRCHVLGPGLRSVLWVQGCPLRCAGCVAPETLPTGPGPGRTIADLAGWLCSVPDTEGVTLSGGEPFAQAAALAAVLDEVRAARPEYTAVVYSGFRHEALLRMGRDARALLDRADLLIDGPFQQRAQADLLWRGSANQRLIPLSDRYRTVPAPADRGAGIEVELDPDGSLSWAGVPGEPGFRERLEAGLAELGHRLAPVSPGSF